MNASNEYEAENNLDTLQEPGNGAYQKGKSIKKRATEINGWTPDLPIEIQLSIQMVLFLFDHEKILQLN